MVNDTKSQPRLSIALIVVAAVMLVAASVEMAITGYAFAYDRNQAASSTNACGNGELPTNVGCQNTVCQIQGDENSCALTSQQTFPSVTVPPPEETATLIVIKEVECAEGRECPGLPEPSEFTLAVVPSGQAAIPVGAGSEFAFGEPIPIPPGDYQVTGDINPPNVDGLDFVSVEPGDGCSSDPPPVGLGPIQAGEERTCTFTNFYAPQPA